MTGHDGTLHRPPVCYLAHTARTNALRTLNNRTPDCAVCRIPLPCVGAPHVAPAALRTRHAEGNGNTTARHTPL